MAKKNCACYADIAVGSKGARLGKFSQILSRANSAGSSLSCWKGGATRMGFRLAVAAVIDDHTLVFDRVADVLFTSRRAYGKQMFHVEEKLPPSTRNISRPVSGQTISQRTSFSLELSP